MRFGSPGMPRTPLWDSSDSSSKSRDPPANGLLCSYRCFLLMAPCLMRSLRSIVKLCWILAMSPRCDYCRYLASTTAKPVEQNVIKSMTSCTKLAIYSNISSDIDDFKPPCALLMLHLHIPRKCYTNGHPVVLTQAIYLVVFTQP